MKKLLILLLTLIIYFPLFSQTRDFKLLFNKAEERYENKDFISAFVYFDKALEKAVRSEDTDAALIMKEDCRRRIRQQQDSLQFSLIETENARHKADSALGVARNIVSAFYFFDEKLALAF